MSEINDLTFYQQRLHSLNESERSAGYHINSLFFRRPDKFSYHTQQLSLANYNKFPKTDSHTVVEYTIQTWPHQGLGNSFLFENVPSIKAITPSQESGIDHYNVRWKNDLLFRIIQEFSVDFENININKYPSSYFIFHTESEISNESKIRCIKEGVGNLEELTSWNTELPQRYLHYILPLFYSKSPVNYFPLYMCGKSNKFTHTGQFNLDISTLLEIQEVRRVEGVLEKRIIPFDKSLIIIGNSRSPPNTDDECNLPVPLLYLEYLNFTSRELEVNRCLATDEHCNNFYYDYVSMLLSQDDTMVGSGKTSAISFTDSEEPIHTIYWYAQNSDEEIAYEISESLTESPFESATIKKGTEKFMDLPSYITEKVMSQLHFSGTPRKRGLNMWTNQNYTGDAIPTPPGKNFRGYRFESKIKSIVPREIQYRIRLLTVSTRHYYFKNYPKTEEERESAISSIKFN